MTRLPVGRKPLPVILRAPDPCEQVVALTTLLDYVLCRHIAKEAPSRADTEQSLGALVRTYEAKFSNVADVLFSLQVRNRLSHSNRHAVRAPLVDEVARASKHLTRAIHDLLRCVEEDVKKAILTDPFAEKASKPLAAIEQISDPVERVFALRRRLDALMAQKDAAVGRWTYELAPDETDVTVRHRLKVHLPQYPGVSADRTYAALDICEALDAMTPEQRSHRPLAEYTTAVADLAHVVRAMETVAVRPAAMQGSQQNLVQAPARRPMSTMLYGLAAVAAVVVVAVVFMDALGKKKPDTPLPAGSGGDPAQVARDDRTIALLELRQVENAAGSARVAVEAFEAACASWERDVVPLRTNDAGRRIASSPEDTRAAMAVLDQRREPAASASTLRQNIDELARPAQEALKAKTDYRPTTGAVAKLAEIRGSAERAVETYLSGRAQLLALAEDHASSAPNASTLEQAIATLRAGDDLARARKVGEEQKRAEAAARDAVATAEKKRVDADRDAELRRIATEAALAEKRAEFKRLRSIATDPDIQAQFKPFLQKGTRIPYRDYKGVMWRNAGGRTKLPADAIPYDVLAQARVFQTVEDMVAVGSSSKNDRSFWSAPAATDEKGWAEYRRRFELLKEVAPIWHDMGLLGPPPEAQHLPDPDKLAPEVTAPFQGEWSCPEYGGCIRFEGATGTVVKPSAPSFRVGQTGYLIDEVNGKTLRGRVLFSGGEWVPVTAELVTESKLRFEGNGKQWHLEKNH